MEDLRKKNTLATTCCECFCYQKHEKEFEIQSTKLRSFFENCEQIFAFFLYLNWQHRIFYDNQQLLLVASIRDNICKWRVK